MKEKPVEMMERKKIVGPVCKSNLPKMLDRLMENILANEPHSMDYDLIVRAYFFSDKAHAGQIRKSGDPFISHSVAVANILADLRADDKMLAAALLHDVIEDTDVNYPDVEKEFGTEIAQLVDGVTKLSRMSFTSYQERKAENARKMIFAITKDISVILIKLADRVHNLKTLQYLSEEKQKRIAQDTLDFYAPLAHRLGIYQIKNEMEDLAFKYLMPEEYSRISKQVASRRADRDKEVEILIKQLKDILKPVQIEAEIQGRAKHLYSIYKKMKREGLDFDQIMDLIALRVIVPELKDCYTAVGIIRAVWKPMTEKIKDYIASPKTNMYRSLHTIVMGPQQKPVEIQIRTVEMHRIAEYGIGAHWLYKEGKSKATDFDKHLSFFRQVVDWQSGELGSEDFMESLKIQLLNKEVFVFTPKGEVVALPVDSTPVDFAYQIHTEVGDTCRGALVNKRIVPLDYKLQSGNIVEIITQKNASPSLDWLSIVASNNAKNRIRQFHRKLNREENIDSGRHLLEREERRGGLRALELLTAHNLKPKLGLFNFKDVNSFYAAIGRGDLSPKAAIKTLKDSLIKSLKSKQSMGRPLALTDKIPLEGSAKNFGIVVEGGAEVNINIAKCCLPIYDDRIAGYVSTKRRSITIHRQACKHVSSRALKAERKVEVSWMPGFESRYLSSIDAWALDRVGILNEVTKSVSEMKVSVSDLKMQLARNKTVRFRIRLQVGSKRELENIIRLISKIADVLEVSRSVGM